jgi:hypothetical protein
MRRSDGADARLQRMSKEISSFQNHPIEKTRS